MLWFSAEKLMEMVVLFGFRKFLRSFREQGGWNLGVGVVQMVKSEGRKNGRPEAGGFHTKHARRVAAGHFVRNIRCPERHERTQHERRRPITQANSRAPNHVRRYENNEQKCRSRRL